MFGLRHTYHRVQHARGRDISREAAVHSQCQGVCCIDFLSLILDLQLQLDGIGLLNIERPVVGSPVQGQLDGGFLRPKCIERPALLGLVGGGAVTLRASI